MPISQHALFGVGKTVTSTSTIIDADKEGYVWEEDNKDYTDPAAPVPRSSGGAGMRVWRMVVRNMGAAALLPGRLCAPSTTNYPYRVDGFASTTSQFCFPVDEFLPSAGAAQYSLFHVVIKGPAKIKLPLAGSDFGATAISTGAYMAALTAADTTTTTAGRIRQAAITIGSQDTDATTLLDMSRNLIGRAMEATASTNTGASLLVNVALTF